MSDIPQVTTHYADGTPSETRDMTLEELEQYEIDLENSTPPLGKS